MNVTVLGSNAGGPSRSNPASGYLVESDGHRMWLEAGPGTFMRLASIMDPRDLDCVVLSHTHVDHCADLFALFAYLAYGSPPRDPVPVIAPAGTREKFGSFIGAGADHPFHAALGFVEQGPGSEGSCGPFAMRFGAAVHPVPALVTRIEAGGAVLVYSGDTGPGGDLVELATGAATLLCEAGIQGLRDSDTYPYHLTAFEAGETAAIAGVFDLALTHMSASLDPRISIDEASGAFVGPIIHAAPGTSFTVRTTE